MSTLVDLMHQNTQTSQQKQIILEQKRFNE